MARFRCLLCDATFDREGNHLCARECLPSAGQHADFCKRCKSACLKALEAQMAESRVRERRDDRIKP
jgi:hypothetical protein